ncbi:HlyD family efflux transporter periplasmic adaptor subunit [Spirosoma oryzicola]|uniref:HlyD family efflux transporter periplasmic adaptor subunit n=1 Tax=Spirosoma oryzicola TaxID=2898794 RepID=UPI001E60A9D8|nr:HlyD family efflux transporter periplasmic adaptor subunit [Spirosoma oryzicola]UHG94928.1 HlyD family efflux transporter periplasmic adaptor subunit [Spirosoma oryzicola]
MPIQPEIRSEEMQDIMHRTPSWLTRWGITILLTIVVALLLGASYIAYPDTVTAKVVIESYAKPVTITAPAHAQVRQMIIQDRTRVNPHAALWVWTTGDTLRAPIAGTIHLMGRLDSKNQVVAGETLAIIVPIDAPYRIRGDLPVEGSGKVGVGQPVVIQLDAYPHREFGSLLASVETISPLEVNGYYDIRFSLQNGLVTQQGKPINSRTYLRGKASILTSQRSLLSRIFDII